MHPVRQVTWHDRRLFRLILARGRRGALKGAQSIYFKPIYSNQEIIFDNPAGRIKYLSEKKHESNIFVLQEKLDSLIDACSKVRAEYYMPPLIFLGAEHGASKQES